MPDTLFLVFGDQLAPELPGELALDPERDAIWMGESHEEIAYVPSHKRRIALFLSAMRHYRDSRREEGWTVHYHELTEDPSQDEAPGFAGLLAEALERLKPGRVMAVEPGDWRVRETLTSATEEAGVELKMVDDPHFLCPTADFGGWARGRKRFLLEDFYRWMRKRTGHLMDDDGNPVGGEWNYDKENRDSFGKEGPGTLVPPPRFEPDDTTRDVMALVEARYGDHPGTLEGFAEAVTPDQAREALDAFVQNRLPEFGTYQDALWEGEHFLNHARLSGYLNLKLLNPRDCLTAALEAYESGHAPINAVEGFVRQILGWREYVRGIYWHFMPEYAERNALGTDDTDVPVFFWDGDTEMACVRDAMGNVLQNGYAHHIQRLMVLGLFAQLVGVHPYRFHEWHMALYLDAIDWVSLPNTLGMSQFGDGGVVGTKPYCASGKYIQRMGNHCAGCRYDPAEGSGDDACPFTALYWDFLHRHQEAFRENRRMVFQVKNLDRKKESELEAILSRARELREAAAGGERF